ncbi:MAG: hypothetical protein U1E65_02710 [Myxococcota bacterium]
MVAVHRHHHHRGHHVGGHTKAKAQHKGAAVVAKKVALAPVADAFERVAPPVSAPAAPAPAAEESPYQNGLPILLYNDECATCRRLARWVQEGEAKRPGGVNLLERPIGDDPEALLKLNPSLNIWDAYSTVHVLFPDGSMKVGGEAVAEVLKRVPATAWFSGIFDLSVFGHRPFQAALNAGYYVLDKIRPALGCESCGEPAPAWAKPLEWMVKGYKALFDKKAPSEPPAKP